MFCFYINKNKLTIYLNKLNKLISNLRPKFHVSNCIDKMKIMSTTRRSENGISKDFMTFNHHC